MSWEIGLADISNVAPVSSFRACGKWHGSAPKTSLQLLDNELFNYVFHPQIAEVSFNDTTPPQVGRSRRMSRSRFRYPTGERHACFSFHFRMRRETNQRICTWFLSALSDTSELLPTDDRRTPPEENLSDSLGFQTRIRHQLRELLDRAPQDVLASAHRR